MTVKNMKNENTNWGQSVSGVVIYENKVLLARHTYGGGLGKLIIPGGYVEYGETPQQALIREYLEETGVTVEPLDIIGIRFNFFIFQLRISKTCLQHIIPNLQNNKTGSNTKAIGRYSKEFE